ncbi:MAG: hypothetical protein VX875_06495 [Pseudomonadota bacterium]|nr:hypothetical protein [Pseudomonadota bacterium]
MTQATTVTKQSLAKQEVIDTQKLKMIWQDYQKNIQQMNQEIPSLQAEKDQQKRNARVYTFNRNLEQSKALLKHLVLSNQTAVKLRQSMTNHATKYQNVFKLATLDKTTSSQRNTFERLNAQTDVIYQNMQKTASQLPN